MVQAPQFYQLGRGCKITKSSRSFLNVLHIQATKASCCQAKNTKPKFSKKVEWRHVPQSQLSLTSFRPHFSLLCVVGCFSWVHSHVKLTAHLFTVRLTNNRCKPGIWNMEYGISNTSPFLKATVCFYKCVHMTVFLIRRDDVIRHLTGVLLMVLQKFTLRPEAGGRRQPHPIWKDTHAEILTDLHLAYHPTLYYIFLALLVLV